MKEKRDLWWSFQANEGVRWGENCTIEDARSSKYEVEKYAKLIFFNNFLLKNWFL